VTQDLLTLVPRAEAAEHAATTVERLLEELAARDRMEGDVGFRDQARTHSPHASDPVRASSVLVSSRFLQPRSARRRSRAALADRTSS